MRKLVYHLIYSGIRRFPPDNIFARRLLRRKRERGNETAKIAGDTFDRFRGLDYALQRANDCTVLDYGSSDGLVAYEFARHGVRLIHGFEIDRERREFATRLFRKVPVESEFCSADLSIQWDRFERKFEYLLLDTYDIVLYLGVYHHLRKQMDYDALHVAIRGLARRAGKLFVVRSNRAGEISGLLEEEGFRCAQHVPRGPNRIGALWTYERTLASQSSLTGV